MTAKELEEALRVQTEKEKIEHMISEYNRLKKIVVNIENLSYDEVCNITMELCRNRDVFNTSRPW